MRAFCCLCLVCWFSKLLDLYKKVLNCHWGSTPLVTRVVPSSSGPLVKECNCTIIHYNYIFEITPCLDYRLFILLFCFKTLGTNMHFFLGKNLI